MSGLQDWLVGLFCAALLGVICTALVGEDSRAMRLSVGMVLLLALCAPLSELNLSDISQLLSQTRIEAQASVSGIEVENRELLAQIISEQTQAYILDKAAEMDMALAVQVTVTQGESYPYPSGVSLTGHTTTAQRARLGEWITQQLAIPREEQRWNESNP